MSLFVPALILFGIMFLASAIRILNEYERGVIFRLGRLIGSKGPGLIILIPIIDKLQKISLRLVTLDVPSQDVIPRDNVSVKVNAVLYFRVMDPNKAVVEVENFLYATSQLAQTTLRSVCGQAELDELLAERDQARGQRSRKRHPVGGFRSDGGVPGMPARRCSSNRTPISGRDEISRRV